MASFADSVIKDQKEQIRAEDEKMMKHIEKSGDSGEEETPVAAGSWLDI